MKGYKLTSRGVWALSLFLLAVLMIFMSAFTFLSNNPQGKDPFFSPSPPAVFPGVSTQSSDTPDDSSDPSNSDVPDFLPDPALVSDLTPDSAPDTAATSTRPAKTPDASPVPTEPGSYQALVFSLSKATLTMDTYQDLGDFLSEAASAGAWEDSILVIEGRAWSNEAAAEGEVRALANARAQAVYEYCQSQGIKKDQMITVANALGDAPAVISGVALRFVPKKGK